MFHLLSLAENNFHYEQSVGLLVRIESMMAKRDKYLRKFNRAHSLDMEYLYKKFRNKTVSEIRKSKDEYYAEYFAKHKTNIEVFWSGIRCILTPNRT